VLRGVQVIGCPLVLCSCVYVLQFCVMSVRHALSLCSVHRNEVSVFPFWCWVHWVVSRGMCCGPRMGTSHLCLGHRKPGGPSNRPCPPRTLSYTC
jgi:hypothetical protein